METIKYKGFDIDIKFDDLSLNPRTEWDNLGTMVCFHNRYQLGDLDTEHHNDEDFQKFLESDEIAVVLSLYLYDHSGITIRTSAFSCGFDSGKVGVIYITKEEARKQFEIKRITKSWKKKLTEYLESEVKTYDNFLTGEVFYYNIEGVEDASCGGFYGYDHDKSGLLENAKANIDYEIRSRIKSKLSRLKRYIQTGVPIIYRDLSSFA